MQVGVHQGSMLLPLLFAIVVVVITENMKNSLMNETWHADDLILMSESSEFEKKVFEIGI